MQISVRIILFFVATIQPKTAHRSEIYSATSLKFINLKTKAIAISNLIFS